MPTFHQQTILYADCFSGISGDMFIGALLSAGLPFAKLQEELSHLAIDDYKLSCKPAQEKAIAATNFSVHSTKKDHSHRGFADIQDLILTSKLSDAVQQKAIAVFSSLAEAEAAVHGTPIDKVHFHEVGAVDSIIDIVGAAIGLEYFKVDSCACSPLPMPSGWVHCDHGQLPLPAPAVCELTKQIPVYGVEHKTELVTPTGAAIIKTFATDFGPMPKMVPVHIGYGAGDKELADGQPNLLRIVIGHCHQSNEFQEVIVSETNLDDWPPERVPYLTEKLFELGALDVVIIPTQMKKNRPGFTLQIISSQALAWELQKTVLCETSAIGLRFRKEQRWTLPREHGVVACSLGDVRAKRIQHPNGIRLTPEFNDCRKIAKRNNIPLDHVYNEVLAQPSTAFKADK